VDKAQEEAGQKWGHTKNKAGEFVGSVQDTAGAAGQAAAEEILAVDETPAGEEAPTVEEMAAIAEALAEEDRLVVDETPSTEVA
jgi:hypothetical protein